MKKALVVVDYQYDFIASDGALTVGKDGQDIEKNIVAKAKELSPNDVFFTLDFHQEENWEKDNFHPEGKIFPKHCIEKTAGYEIFGELKDLGAPKANYTNKYAYCPNPAFLDKLTDNYDEIEVCGVVTDICVFQTVVGLYTSGINKKKPVKLSVSKNCCASFDKEREAFSLKYMADVLGVDVK